MIDKSAQAGWRRVKFGAVPPNFDVHAREIFNLKPDSSFVPWLGRAISTPSLCAPSPSPPGCAVTAAHSNGSAFVSRA